MVASIDAVHAALSVHSDVAMRTYPAIRRRFDYAALIVALYASVEKYAEDLVLSYALLVTKNLPYQDLPESLKRKHLTRSADLLARGRIGEGRYEGLRELDVVKNLYLCLSGDGGYVLNGDAIVAHDINLRYEELAKLFAAVGIEGACDRARRSEALVTWYKSITDAKEDELPQATLQNRLDDLVTRRNEVTHRGDNPSELIGTEDMRELIDFIEALGRSLFSVAVDAYLGIAYPLLSGHAERLEVTEGPYGNGRNIVVVTKPKKRLFVGQPIFASNKESGARWGRIIGLRLKDVPATEVEPSSPVLDVGVEVSFRCSKAVALSILDVEDDAIWSPTPPIPPASAPPSAASM